MPEAASKSFRVAPVGRFAKWNRPERLRFSGAMISIESKFSRAWVKVQPPA
jgi:hypothetical protein